jgi:RNA polymerase sigma-70 factor (ECF subfamily)
MGVGTLTSTNEPELLEKARRGDHRAFADLLRLHDPGMRALAYRLLGDVVVMDDALQEAYVKAYRALPRFRGESSVGTWLYRIVHNACIDLLRRQREEEPLFDGAPVDVVPALDGTVATSLDVGEALATMSLDHRSVLVLVDALGFDYGDAAEVLNVPVGTIRSRLARARRAMRRQLGEGG